MEPSSQITKRNENAIIMAAGLSSRFAPLSVEYPKALLRVKGEVLIERQIRQLLEAGIKDITLVVGYKKELFHYLIQKFDISIVENPDYQERNNHSSLYHVREKLGNTYVCSADNYFSENVFKKVLKHASYSCVYQEGPTEEWCVTTDTEGLIVDMTIGGEDSWIMMGHVYFSDEFSQKLIPFIEETYHNEEKAGFLWEEIYRRHVKELCMYIHPYKDGIIFEFDSLDDLRLFDSSYENHTGSKIMKTLSKKLNCEEKDIQHIVPEYEGQKVVGFTFKIGEKQYLYCYETDHILTK